MFFKLNRTENVGNTCRKECTRQINNKGVKQQIVVGLSAGLPTWSILTSLFSLIETVHTAQKYKTCNLSSLLRPEHHQDDAVGNVTATCTQYCRHMHPILPSHAPNIAATCIQYCRHMHPILPPHAPNITATYTQHCRLIHPILLQDSSYIGVGHSWSLQHSKHCHTVPPFVISHYVVCSKNVFCNRVSHLHEILYQILYLLR